MNSPRNLLAVRFGRLGDVILLLRSLAALKTKWPEAHLVLLTDHRYAPLAALCPYIDEILPVNRLGMRDGNKLFAAVGMGKLLRSVRTRRFDVAIDFHGFLETQFLVGLSRSRLRVGIHRTAKRWMGFCFDRPPVVEDKSVHVSDMFQRVAAAAAEGQPLPQPGAALLKAPVTAPFLRSPSRIAGFYTGAGAPDRMWPPAKFAQLADLLAEQGADILLLGGTSAWEVDARSRIASQCKYPNRVLMPQVLSTAELVAAISQCSILVSNDTGPMHIGPALAVPTVGLFSVGFPEHYRPYGAGNAFIQAETMDAIRAEDVFAEIRRVCGDFSGLCR